MKKLIAVFAVSGLVMLAGCCKPGYKSEYVYSFVSACIQGNGSVVFCSCIMDVMQEKISQKEFLDEDAKYAAEKKFSDKFNKVLEEGKTKCAK